MSRLEDPEAIERKSFEIIEGLLAGLDIPEGQKAVVARVVHATGDPDYAGLIRIHPEAIETGLKAIRAGSRVYTDVNMVKVGINLALLKRFGGELFCHVADEQVLKEARRHSLTRAATAMRLYGSQLHEQIVVVGNAPTALFEVCSLVRKDGVRPSLIIGTPVGFVGAAEAKRQLAELDVPYITIVGQKGGSTVAVAIFNALLHMA